MDSAIVSGLSALGGATLGAFASIATTWLGQHYQERSQRRAQATARRERLFSEFIDLASKLWAEALTHKLTDVAVLVPLYALRAQICVFADSSDTVDRADEVLRRIGDAYFGPIVEIRSSQDLEHARYDVLHAFTIACRAELQR